MNSADSRFYAIKIGRYNCVGRSLAYMEMRYVTALLALEFDFEFAPGESGERVEGEMKDQFTSNPGPLKLVFKKRQRP